MRLEYVSKRVDQAIRQVMNGEKRQQFQRW